MYLDRLNGTLLPRKRSLIRAHSHFGPFRCFLFFSTQQDPCCLQCRVQNNLGSNKHSAVEPEYTSIRNRQTSSTEIRKKIASRSHTLYNVHQLRNAFRSQYIKHGRHFRSVRRVQLLFSGPPYKCCTYKLSTHVASGLFLRQRGIESFSIF